VLVINHYDAEPTAMNVPYVRCVVCGEHDGDLIVTWFSDLDSHRDTIPLGVHKGQCDQRLQAAATQPGSWEEARTLMSQASHNTQHPPVDGVEDPDGSRLLRRVEYGVDLRWTDEILTRLGSPLLASKVSKR
jgi:hypothetical protein